MPAIRPRSRTVQEPVVRRDGSHQGARMSPCSPSVRTARPPAVHSRPAHPGLRKAAAPAPDARVPQTIGPRLPRMAGRFPASARCFVQPMPWPFSSIGRARGGLVSMRPNDRTRLPRRSPAPHRRAVRVVTVGRRFDDRPPRTRCDACGDRRDGRSVHRDGLQAEEAGDAVCGAQIQRHHHRLALRVRHHEAAPLGQLHTAHQGKSRRRLKCKTVYGLGRAGTGRMGFHGSSLRSAASGPILPAAPCRMVNVHRTIRCRR